MLNPAPICRSSASRPQPLRLRSDAAPLGGFADSYYFCGVTS